MSDAWYKTACLRCSYGEHTPRPSDRCPYDGTVLLRMEGFIAADDVIAVARSYIATLQGTQDLRNASSQLADNIGRGMRRLPVPA